VLGTEPEIVATYVDSGQVRLVYWPMLDHGAASQNAHAAAECIGCQSVDAFWQAHDEFYARQAELWQAGRDDFAAIAAGYGLDRAAFEQCYDGGDAHATVMALDRQRRDLGILTRPSFDVNGQFVAGAQPFELFAQYIEAALQTQ
jgi:protein-disulfide isomerase